MAVRKVEERLAGPASPRKRRRRSPEEIRERLLRAAKIEFENSGYAGATTAAISKRADVAEIQMFRYFPSKADLFREAIFAPLVEHFKAFNAEHAPKAVSKASIEASARLYVAELQSFLDNHTEMLIALFTAQTFAEPALEAAKINVEDLQAFLNESATLMSKRASSASGIDPSKIVRVAFGAMLGCITYRDWLFPDASDEKAEIDEAIAEFILAGVGPHSDLGRSGA